MEIEITFYQRKKEFLHYLQKNFWYFQQDGAPCHRPLKVKIYTVLSRKFVFDFLLIRHD